MDACIIERIMDNEEIDSTILYNDHILPLISQYVFTRYLIVFLYNTKFNLEHEVANPKDITNIMEISLGDIPYTVIESDSSVGIEIGDYKSFLIYQQIQCVYKDPTISSNTS